MSLNRFLQTTGITAILSGCYVSPASDNGHDLVTYTDQCSGAVQRVIETSGCGVAIGRSINDSLDTSRGSIRGGSDAYLIYPDNTVKFQNLISGGLCWVSCRWVAPSSLDDNGRACDVFLTLTTTGQVIDVTAGPDSLQSPACRFSRK